MAARHPMPAPVWALLNIGGRLSGPPGRIVLRTGLLGDLDAHYVLYDASGTAVRTAGTFLEAMRFRRGTGLYVTRILD